jgi:hypothetical protein
MRKEGKMQFNIGKLTQSEWVKASKECEFESERATAAIRIPEIAYEKADKLYVLCLETRGVKYAGRSDN